MKRVERVVLALAALAAAAAAQPTQVPASVIRPGTVVGVLVCLPPGTASTGGCVLAALDSTIALDLSVTPPVLKAIAPAPKQRKYGVVLTAPYTLPAGASNVVVYQNGLRQRLGGDYLIEANAMKPLWPWAVDALVLIDYDQ